MRTLIAIAAALLLAASCHAGITLPSKLTTQSWSTTYNSEWYALDTGITDLLIEGTTSTTVARQISTGTIRKTWNNFDGDDYRILDGSGTSSLNPLKLFSFGNGGTATVLTIKTLGGTATNPTFSNTNYTLPTYQSYWYAMTSVNGVVYLYRRNYVIGIQASNGALVTNMTLDSSWQVSSNSLPVGYAYADGAKFLSFQMYYGSSRRQVTLDVRRNYVTSSCSISTFYSTSYSSTYPAFAPSYVSGSSTMYPMIFAWGSSSSSTSYTYGSMANVTTGTGSFTGSCSTVWRRATSSSNIPTIRTYGSLTFIRPGMPFSFQDTTNAIYTSYGTSSYSGKLVWLNYRSGVTTRSITVDSGISYSQRDQCSSSKVAGPSFIGTDLLLSFDMYLYQYRSSSTTTTYTWRKDYNSVFNTYDDVDDAGCAPWRYKVVGSKSLFITNSGNAEMAAMVIGSGSSSNNDGSSSSSWGSSSYSPYYRVSLTSGATGTTAKLAIQAALTRVYGISSGDTSSWYYDGIYTTFRIYGGISWDSDETAAKNGLYNAQTNSTLRAELGFASCTQTISPNFGAAVAAAFGTLFLVLILIGVALLICVIAIIVCCCCCTAKAVADASAPPQQTVVMANQAAYVPMNQQVGYAQPGQVQGGNML